MLLSATVLVGRSRAEQFVRYPAESAFALLGGRREFSARIVRNAGGSASRSAIIKSLRQAPIAATEFVEAMLGSPAFDMHLVLNAFLRPGRQQLFVRS